MFKVAHEEKSDESLVVDEFGNGKVTKVWELYAEDQLVKQSRVGVE